MHPSLRKGAITDPTPVPFINYPDSVYIQDDQFLPEYSQEIPLQYVAQDQARLHSPFEYHHNLDFVSPPSSVPSSPTSSPASSVSHLPATTAASADYSSVFDGSSSFEAPSMTPASSYNPEIHVQHSDSPQYLPQYNQQQFVFNHSPMLAQQQFMPNNHSWGNNLPLSSPSHGRNVSRMPQQFNGQQTSNPAKSPNHNRPAYGAPTKLPTPVHTPVQQPYLTPQYQKSDVQDGNYPYAPEQKHQHQSSDSHASLSTVSHNSPVTPQNQFEEEDSKPAMNGKNLLY